MNLLMIHVCMYMWYQAVALQSLSQLNARALLDQQRQGKVTPPLSAEPSSSSSSSSSTRERERGEKGESAVASIPPHPSVPPASKE